MHLNCATPFFATRGIARGLLVDCGLLLPDSPPERRSVELAPAGPRSKSASTRAFRQSAPEVQQDTQDLEPLHVCTYYEAVGYPRVGALTNRATARWGGNRGLDWTLCGFVRGADASSLI